MIDIVNEELIRLGEVPAKLKLVRHQGKKLSIGTVFRWSTSGVKGVVLKTLQVGGARVTSHNALQRFFESLSQSKGHKGVGIHPTPQFRSDLNRRHSIEAADRELDRLGM